MNGNPFYVKPVFDDQSENVLRFAQMGMQQDQLKEARAMDEKKFTAEQDYRNKVLANQQEDTNIRKEALYNQNPNLRPFSNSEYTTLISKATMAKLPVEKLSFFSNDLKNLAADPNIRRGDVASVIEQKWPEIYQQTSDEIRNEIVSLSKKAADMNPSDPKYKEVADQIQRLSSFQTSIDNVQNPKSVFFPDIAEHEANTKAALAAQGDATRAARLNPDTQFLNARTIEYMNKGIPEAEAVTKAYADKRKMDAETARAGKIDVNTGENKQDIKVYVDKFNGARHVINLKNPAHKRWLAKYGKQLVPETEAKDMEFNNDTQPATSKYQVKVKK